MALADALKESAGDIATKSDLLALENRFVERIVKVEERISRVEGRLNLVQWMVGFNLALSVALLWLLIRMQ